MADKYEHCLIGYIIGGLFHLITFNTSLPDSVYIFKAGDDVVRDDKGELEVVSASFLEGEETVLGIGS